MRIGIICPSEIAFRRFMPAIQLIDTIEFAGVGVYTKEERFGQCMPSEKIINEIMQTARGKADAFTEQYGGRIYDGYKTIITSNDIEAIYIPLPPALHFYWAKLALENGKHVIIEKPSTISADYTKELVMLAKKNKLVLHENYMFTFHTQLNALDQIIASGEIGDVRLYRITFGFPQRSGNDFRYNKELGGGALFDAGGYTLKYAAWLLGKSVKIKYVQLNYTDRFDVDIYGSAALVNDVGVTAQIAFGLDNSYKCELEVWGSKGYLISDRIFTAPVGFEPEVRIRRENIEEKRKLPADDAFKKSVLHFLACIGNDESRCLNYEEIISQAELIDDFRKKTLKHFDGGQNEESCDYRGK